MGELPEERLKETYTFENCGVDLAGPFNVRPSRIKFDKVIKVWISLFICLATKAVHLEIVTDLSAESFMAAFARFTSIRGEPRCMFSDNAGNFTASSRLIREAWEKMTDSAKRSLALQHIDWKFMPPYGPEMAGVWESQIKVMKSFIKKMAKVENLVLEEFSTLICRVQGMMNSRPLYPCSDQPSDELALTPQHFLTLRAMMPTLADEVQFDRSPVTKRWLEVKKLIAHFWQTIQTDCYATLQRRYKWKFPTRNVEVDDVVLVTEMSTTPAYWKLGRVTKVFPDAHGTVRKVELKTAQRETVLRPVNRLVPLLPSLQQESAPRRSARLAKDSAPKSLFIRALICMIALAGNSTNALTIQPLTNGVHIQRLRPVAAKAFDLEFSVKTSVNVTDDLIVLHQQLDDFSTFCSSLASIARTLSQSKLKSWKKNWQACIT